MARRGGIEGWVLGACLTWLPLDLYYGIKIVSYGRGPLF